MIDISSIKGFKIKYATVARQFVVMDAEGNEVASADTQIEAEDKATKLAKKSFEPLVAFKLHYDGADYGRVTSINADDKTAYFSYDDKRRQTTVKFRLRGQDDVYLRTDQNDQVLALIAECRTAIAEQQARVTELKGQLEKPIDVKFFGLQNPW